MQTRNQKQYNIMIKKMKNQNGNGNGNGKDGWIGLRSAAAQINVGK